MVNIIITTIVIIIIVIIIIIIVIIVIIIIIIVSSSSSPSVHLPPPPPPLPPPQQTCKGCFSKGDFYLNKEYTPLWHKAMEMEMGERRLMAVSLGLSVSDVENELLHNL